MNIEQYKKLCAALHFTCEQEVLIPSQTDEVTTDIDLKNWPEDSRIFVDWVVTSFSLNQTMLLTSWYFVYLKGDLREEIIEFISWHIKHGHAVYVSQENGFNQIEDVRNIEKEILHLKPINTEKAIDLAMKQGLHKGNKSSLEVIHTRRLQDISEYVAKHVLNTFSDVNDFPYSYPELHEDKIKTMLDVLDPQDKFTKTINDGSTFQPENRIRALIVRRLLSDEEINEIHQCYPNIDRIVLSVKIELIIKLLTAYSNLSKLKIKELDMKSALSNFQFATLCNVTDLIIVKKFGDHYTNFEIDMINKLLMHVPRLSNLELSDFSAINISEDLFLTLKPNQLQHLKLVKLLGRFNSHHIKHLMSATSALTHATFIHSVGFDFRIFDEYRQPHLSELDIKEVNGYEPTPVSLISLLEKFPKLSVLKIHESYLNVMIGYTLTLNYQPWLEKFKQIKEWSIEESGYFRSKKTLSLNNSTKFFQFFSDMVSLAWRFVDNVKSFFLLGNCSELPYLTHVEMSVVDLIPLLSGIVSVSPQLSVLKLNTVVVASKRLGNILLQASNLETLNLKNCKFPDSDSFQLPIKHLSKLRCLSFNVAFDDSSIAKVSNAILNAAPFISQFTSYGFCDEGQELAGAAFQNLTKVDLKDIWLFKSIVESAPNLHSVNLTLDIYNQINVIRRLPILKQAQNLVVEIDEVDEETPFHDYFNLFLERFPNISYLEIIDCPLLDISSLILPKKVKTLVLSGSPVTLQPLKTMLRNSHITEVSFDFEDAKDFDNEDCKTLKKEFPHIHFNISGKEKNQIHSANSVSENDLNDDFLNQVPTELSTYGNLIDDPNTILHAEKKFEAVSGRYDAMVSQDHLSVYQYKPHEQHPWKMYQPDARDLDLIWPLSTTFNQNNIIPDYIGREKYQQLAPGVWHKLPGRSCYDLIVDYCCEPRFNLQFARDRKSGYLYFIFLSNNCVDIDIAYQLTSIYSMIPPLQSQYHFSHPVSLIRYLQFDASGKLEKNGAYFILLNFPKPHLIKLLVSYCSFPEFAGAVNLSHCSSPQILNYLLARRVGACLPRAQLCVALAAELGLDAFLVNNGVHAFFVVNDGVKFPMAFNLGGSPTGQLKINDSVFSTRTQSRDSKNDTPLLSNMTQCPDSKNDIESDATPLISISPDNRFQTWKHLPLKAHDASSLIHELIEHNRPRRQLLIVKQESHIETLHDAFLQLHEDERQFCFFTPHLDALTVHVKKIAQGVSCETDSALGQFLKKRNSFQPLTLFINWCNPKTHHSSVETILDDDPQLEGVDVSHVRVVIVMDEQSVTNIEKTNADFFRQMDVMSRAPFLEELPQPKLERKPILDQDVLLLTPYDWKKLQGSTVLNGKKLAIQPGIFLNAAIKNIPVSVTIHNAPWGDWDFRWTQREIEYTKSFFYNGDTYHLPQSSTIQFAIPEINFSSLFPQHQSSSSATKKSQHVFVLNDQTFPAFLPGNKVTSQGLKARDGLFKIYENQDVLLKVTGPLSGVKWKILSNQSEACHVSSSLQTSTKEINLPDGLTVALEPSVLVAANSSNISVFVAEDVHFQLDEILKTASMNCETIPVNAKTKFESLLIHVLQLDGELIGKETDFLRAIKSGVHVILYGYFPKEMVQKLETLFVEAPYLLSQGEPIPVTGKITLISDKRSGTFFSNIKHEISRYNPNIDLNRLPEYLAAKIIETYQKLKIYPKHMHFVDFPSQQSDRKKEIWCDDLIHRLHLSVGIFLHSTTHADACQTHSSSVYADCSTGPEELLEYFKNKFLVCLISDTGAGKSYLFQNRLSTFNQNIKTYLGVNQFEQWLQSTAPMAIQFDDEANFRGENFTVYDNRLRGENICWWKGNKYPLGDQHRAGMALNPFDYGNGRLLPDILHNFPYYKEFIGQSIAAIIKPLLANFKQGQQFGEMIHHYYKQVQEFKIPISPRNAQQMCLTAYILRQQIKNSCLTDAVIMHYAVLCELNTVMPDRSRTKSLRQQLKNSSIWQESGHQLKTELNQLLLSVVSRHADYWTNSQKKIALMLMLLLKIREEKMRTGSRFQQHHGLNGLLLEGKTDFGVIEFCMELLELFGIKSTVIELGSKPQEARKKMQEACRQGGIVLIRKQSGVDEKLFNEALSGIAGEEHFSEHPGLLVIGVNIESLSKAMVNRAVNVSLKDFTVEELDMKLMQFKLGKNAREQLLREFDPARKYARQEGFFPLPTVSRLFMEAEKVQSCGNSM